MKKPFQKICSFIILVFVFGLLVSLGVFIHKISSALNNRMLVAYGLIELALFLMLLGFLKPYIKRKKTGSDAEKD